ncbi:hypothetical protein MXB_3706 [Myxobolus squamalis]|nr:hypothetical protein MXB_3706 [Myxobolus squamalis]
MLFLKTESHRNQRLNEKIVEYQKILVQKGYCKHTLIDFFEQGEAFLDELCDPSIDLKVSFVTSSYSLIKG